MKTNKCAVCEGTGIVNVPNGEDDFDVEACACPKGQALEESAELEAVRNEAMRLVAHND